MARRCLLFAAAAAISCASLASASNTTLVELVAVSVYPDSNNCSGEPASREYYLLDLCHRYTNGFLQWKRVDLANATTVVPMLYNDAACTEPNDDAGEKLPVRELGCKVIFADFSVASQVVTKNIDDMLGFIVAVTPQDSCQAAAAGGDLGKVWADLGSQDKEKPTPLTFVDPGCLGGVLRFQKGDPPTVEYFQDQDQLDCSGEQTSPARCVWIPNKDGVESRHGAILVLSGQEVLNDRLGTQDQSGSASIALDRRNALVMMLASFYLAAQTVDRR